MPVSIVVLAHERDAFDEKTYFLKEMSELWRQSGLSVTVLNGPGSVPDADLCIVHVDLTVIPADYLAFAQKFPLALNIKVKDISKRVISAQLVSRGSAYAGPVVVKTNRNHGGASEARMISREAVPATALSSNVHFSQWQHWSHQSYLPSLEYPVFDSIKQVPLNVWRNSDLVVERFLPEKQDQYYCLRTWVFLGDKETNSICYSEEPIIKSSNIVRREKVAEVPEELRQMRRDLGFDFGKFDYAIVDGRVVLYDANLTPSLGRFSKEQFLPNLQLLAQGIHAYL